MRLRPRPLPLVLAALATMVPAAAWSAARVLDEQGNLLIVDNFVLTTRQGLNSRQADPGALGWELRSFDGVVLAEGNVPGCDGPGLDQSPSLSLDPLTGSIWLAWSRQPDIHQPHDIACVRFQRGAFDAASLRTIAMGSESQVDPAIIHDGTGMGWLAWADASHDYAIRLVSLDGTGQVQTWQNLTDTVSAGNGPPAVGIDSTGQVLVAYLGFELGSRDQRMFVLAPNPGAVGVTHIPNPLIELGLKAEQPMMTSAPEIQTPLGRRVAATVHLNVLGTTPLAWWVETRQGSDAAIHYLAEQLAGWGSAEVQSLDLASGGVPSVMEALTLLEGRIRRAAATHRVIVGPIHDPIGVTPDPIEEPWTLGTMRVYRKR